MRKAYLIDNGGEYSDWSVSYVLVADDSQKGDIEMAIAQAHEDAKSIHDKKFAAYKEAEDQICHKYGITDHWLIYRNDDARKESWEISENIRKLPEYNYDGKAFIIKRLAEFGVTDYDLLDFDIVDGELL